MKWEEYTHSPTATHVPKLQGRQNAYMVPLTFSVQEKTRPTRHSPGALGPHQFLLRPCLYSPKSTTLPLWSPNVGVTILLLKITQEI